MKKKYRGKKKGYFVNYKNSEYGFGVVAYSSKEAKALFWNHGSENEWEKKSNIQVKIIEEANISDLPIGLIDDDIIGLKVGLYACFEGCCPICEIDDEFIIKKDGIIGCFLCISEHCINFNKETEKCNNADRNKELSERIFKGCDPEDCKFWKKDDIEVLDKINNLSWKIDQNQSVIIHPNKSPVVLDDYRRKEMYISGIIFHKDGSSEVLSKRRK